MYRSMMDCVIDLERHGQLLRVKEEVDPYLEMAEIHRQVFDKQGPAIFFEKVKNSPFPAVSNIYGTFERTEFLFRKSLPKVKKVISLKKDPTLALKQPFKYFNALTTALNALPRRSIFNTPVLQYETRISELPQVVSWPKDGGGFITLPQVISVDPEQENIMNTNIGMYRIQMSGNDYILNEEIGLHYQLHRGIGIHHTKYNALDKPFKVSIAVGGPPSYAFSAIMPLPEGLSEVTFAGMLADRRYRYIKKNGYYIPTDADFVITGIVQKDELKKEGPFGDHLGYYSLAHNFPIMKVENVYHRKNAVWQFTVVGRPPAEDSSFGHLIHLLVSDLVTDEFPGLIELNAVDSAGVHPLLLAIAKERYMPFREKKPEEILTIANKIIGTGQTSLSKYLFIAAFDANHPNLTTKNLKHFFDYFLRRADWRRDLHFYTRTTIDTLDYSGSGWNEGSKVVITCCGDPIRNLGSSLPNITLNSMFKSMHIIQDGVLAIQAIGFTSYNEAKNEIHQLETLLDNEEMVNFPLVILCDDSAFVAENIDNFVWATFTRSNPSHDIYGVNSYTEYKHWGCKGSLIIDARIKPHHAPTLEPELEIQQSVMKKLLKYSF